MKSRLHKTRRFARQLGQGMTEYIIIVAVIAIGSIAVYSYFGNTLRNQTAAAAQALAGQDGSNQTKAAQTAATAAAGAVDKNLSDFAKK
jgi:Flp pilus assembly pilin Flp